MTESGEADTPGQAAATPTPQESAPPGILGHPPTVRTIHEHEDGHGLTESLTITADGPGPGGASHQYVVTRELVMTDRTKIVLPVARIQFQSGPRDVPGSIPGIVESVLLAIVVDRMRSFQSGEYACRENALVMTHTQEALHWLRHRADDRARREVLGTAKV